MSLYFKCLYIIFIFLITINAPAQERLALVIGNSDYQNGKDLKNPVNDATDLAAVLTQLDFKVIHKNNLNLREMKEAINQFGSKLRKSGGVGLFYFSGHGVQHKGTNYLIPIGAMRFLSVAEQLPYEAVNAGYVLAAMKKTANNQLNIVILDACRNNPFNKGLGGIVSDGLVAPTTTPSGFLIAYATEAGKMAIDGNERNSPYVKHLMRELLKPNLMIEQMLKQVRVAVKKETHGIQHPAYYAAIDQDFYFNPTKPDKVEEKVSPKVVTPIESKQVASASSSSFVEKLKWVTMIVIVILFIWGLFSETGEFIFDYLILSSPLLIPSLALGFEFLPNPAKTWSPEVYLWISAGLIGISLFVIILNEEIWLILMLGIIGIIAIIAIFTDGFLVIGVAVSIGLLMIIFRVMIENLEDNIFATFLVLLMIADYIFLIYYCFFDGWRLFV